MVTIFHFFFLQTGGQCENSSFTKSKPCQKAFVRYELNFDQSILTFSRGIEHLLS